MYGKAGAVTAAPALNVKEPEKKEKNKDCEKVKFLVDKRHLIVYNPHCACGKQDMHEWLSGGVSPCQGEGRGFESRLVLLKAPEDVCFQGAFSMLDFTAVRLKKITKRESAFLSPWIALSLQVNQLLFVLSHTSCRNG